jgi:precorrin-6A/cobalt-precorrin-6A reductase
VRERAKIDDAVYLSSLENCVEFLKNVQGCVFFTTGSKNIRDFQEVRGANRFVYRVLPTSSSISECTKHHVTMKDIIAILGPVSEELNVAMFQAYRAKYVVMKDSGEAGGTPEKLNACHRLGIVPVMIGRVDEDGISDLETLVKMIVRNFS